MEIHEAGGVQNLLVVEISRVLLTRVFRRVYVSI
jgi:hypothetical protein